MSEFLSIYALLLTKVHTKLPFAVFVGRLANPLSHEAFSVFDHITCVIVSLFSCLFSIHNNRYKFDHERVTKEDPKRVLEEQYGGVEELPQTNPGFNNAPFKFTKYSNAYTLNHADVDSFARGVGLVSLLGDKSDGDRKIEDLKLLYRAYVTNALASGHMQDNKVNGHCIQISIFG
ncbi:ubiquitin-specific protease [Trifolium repens]|nr:ubiquitin-specific protease [Trifolium repens]